MHEDGDAMWDHEHDGTQPVRRRQNDSGGATEHAFVEHAARRAAAAGHVQRVERSAVMHLQRTAGNAGVSSMMENEESSRSPVLDVVGKGGGQPMPTHVQAEMESGLGADFSDVRIHDSGVAAASAQAVSAKAYTVGNEIVFNSGAFQPETSEGRHTLAHELTHVVQQRSGPVAGTPTGDGISLSDPSDRFEREAEATASSLGRATPTPAHDAATTASPVQRHEEEQSAQALPLQREESPEEEEMPEAQALPLQREESPEEEEMPEAQALPLQREESPEEEEMPEGV
jgi:hypothetical protein